MAAPRRVGLIFLVVVAGLVVGSLLGEILGGLLPVTVDLRFLAMTFGLSLTVNLMGVAGVVLAALTLRRL